MTITMKSLLGIIRDEYESDDNEDEAYSKVCDSDNSDGADSGRSTE